jgi:hypothetical protein
VGVAGEAARRAGRDTSAAGIAAVAEVEARGGRTSEVVLQAVDSAVVGIEGVEHVAAGGLLASRLEMYGGA